MYSGKILERYFFVEESSRRRQFSSTRFLWFEEISSQKQISSNPNLWRLTIFEDISRIGEKSSKSGSLRQAPKNAIEEKCKYQEISSTKISPTLKISRKTAYIKKYSLHPQLFDEPNRRQIAIFKASLIEIVKRISAGVIIVLQLVAQPCDPDGPKAALGKGRAVRCPAEERNLSCPAGNPRRLCRPQERLSQFPV